MCSFEPDSEGDFERDPDPDPDFDPDPDPDPDFDPDFDPDPDFEGDGWGWPHTFWRLRNVRIRLPACCEVPLSRVSEP